MLTWNTTTGQFTMLKPPDISTMQCWRMRKSGMIFDSMTNLTSTWDKMTLTSMNTHFMQRSWHKRKQGWRIFSSWCRMEWRSTSTALREFRGQCWINTVKACWLVQHVLTVKSSRRWCKKAMALRRKKPSITITLKFNQKPFMHRWSNKNWSKMNTTLKKLLLTWWS